MKMFGTPKDVSKFKALGSLTQYADSILQVTAFFTHQNCENWVVYDQTRWSLIIPSNVYSSVNMINLPMN
jgi:hypothetical protein